jgi:hypothetical protein
VTVCHPGNVNALEAEFMLVPILIIRPLFVVFLGRCIFFLGVLSVLSVIFFLRGSEHHSDFLVDGVPNRASAHGIRADCILRAVGNLLAVLHHTRPCDHE